MRVLVVDDQEEFYQALVPTLRSAQFRSEYAGTAEEACDLASRRLFDLFLVDLQMPPGNWGGLEVVKYLHANDGAAPVIAVSGKGTVAECVSAIRLGARDYIQKERFEIDFNHRVAPLFSVPYAVAAYPSLIAYLYRAFRDEPNEYLKARRLIDVFEFTIRLTSLMALGERCSITGQGILAGLHGAGLERPSLGSYVSYLFGRLDPDPGRGDLVTALQSSDLKDLRKVCDEFTTCRNQSFAHSATISASEAGSIVAGLEPALVSLLNSMAFLRRFELFAAESLEFDGVHFAAEGRVLKGDNLQHPLSVLSIKKPLPTGHVVCLSRDGPAVDLDPLLQVHQSAAGDRQHYAIYDKIGHKGVVYTRIPKAG